MAHQRLINKLCKINDDNKFSSSYEYIYPKQLQLKLEHQGEHATFLDYDITTDFDKKSHVSFLYCMHALSVEQYSIINTAWFNISSKFYGSIFSELMVQQFQTTNSSLYFKADRFCAQGISIV